VTGSARACAEVDKIKRGDLPVGLRQLVGQGADPCLGRRRLLAAPPAGTEMSPPIVYALGRTPQ
jgi:hypothetical protein